MGFYIDIDRDMGPSDRAVDLTLGVILILTSVFGVCGNALAQCYFTRERSKSTNSHYFKRVYQV